MVFALKVFKKTSPNGKVTVYLGKRDFVDNITKIEAVGKIISFLVTSASTQPPESMFAGRWSGRCGSGIPA